MYVSCYLLERSTSLGLFQWAYDFRQGKKNSKNKNSTCLKNDKKKKSFFFFVTFKKPEKP